MPHHKQHLAAVRRATVVRATIMIAIRTARTMVKRAIRMVETELDRATMVRAVRMVKQVIVGLASRRQTTLGQVQVGPFRSGEWLI